MKRDEFRSDWKAERRGQERESCLELVLLEAGPHRTVLVDSVGRVDVLEAGWRHVVVERVARESAAAEHAEPGED